MKENNDEGCDMIKFKEQIMNEMQWWGMS